MEVDTLSGEIGKCLLWLRKSHLLTQYQLASFTELDYRHYQNIESGKVEVKVETLKRICSSFGIGLSTFFYLLDRKHWRTEASEKSRGIGDVYIYRMILEQAKFKLVAPVRDIIGEWGRSIAEGNRDNLKDCPKPCLEVDADLNIHWRNQAASERFGLEEGEVISLLDLKFSEELPSLLREFWACKSHSFYSEFTMAARTTGLTQRYVLFTLRPMMSRPEQTLFLTLVDLREEELLAEKDLSLRLKEANRIFM